MTDHFDTPSMPSVPISEAHFLDWLEPYMEQRMVQPEPPTISGAPLDKMSTADLLALHEMLAKYSDDQARDEHGRWTSGGGSEGDPHSKGGRPDTETLFKKGGVWDPGRVAAVHEPMLAAMRQGVVKAPGGPVLYMTGGGYGSGKSTLLDKFPQVVGFPRVATGSQLQAAFQGQGVIPPGEVAIRADPDAIKAGIPEYQHGASAAGGYDPQAATLVHEESSEVAKVAVREALAGGYSVVYDTSGDTDPDKLAAKVQGFRDEGATRVEANYAFPGSVEEAQSRADARAAASEGLRRYVPPDILRANHSEVANCWLASAENGVFDHLGLWSTAGPFGSPPTLIASAEGGIITVADSRQFAAFTALGTAYGKGITRD